jgi:hypothetical protein
LEKENCSLVEEAEERIRITIIIRMRTVKRGGEN